MRRKSFRFPKNRLEISDSARKKKHDREEQAEALVEHEMSHGS
jgi:hypothetical protein